MKYCMVDKCPETITTVQIGTTEELCRVHYLKWVYRQLDIPDDNNQIKALQAQVVKLRAGLSDILDDCKTGFIACSKCGDQEELSESDMQYTAEKALAEPTPAEIQRIELALKLAASICLYSDTIANLRQLHIVDPQLAEQFQALDQGRQV